MGDTDVEIIQINKISTKFLNFLNIKGKYIAQWVKKYYFSREGEQDKRIGMTMTKTHINAWKLYIY